MSYSVALDVPSRRARAQRHPTHLHASVSNPAIRDALEEVSHGAAG
jgi:CDP-diacylglycerol pyrophosphatase